MRTTRVEKWILSRVLVFKAPVHVVQPGYANFRRMRARSILKALKPAVKVIAPSVTTARSGQAGVFRARNARQRHPAQRRDFRRGDAQIQPTGGVIRQRRWRTAPARNDGILRR